MQGAIEITPIFQRGIKKNGARYHQKIFSQIKIYKSFTIKDKKIISSKYDLGGWYTFEAVFRSFPSFSLARQEKYFSFFFIGMI